MSILNSKYPILSRGRMLASAAVVARSSESDRSGLPRRPGALMRGAYRKATSSPVSAPRVTVTTAPISPTCCLPPPTNF